MAGAEGPPLEGSGPLIRDARAGDLETIRSIYNEGIADRIATLDEDPKTAEEIAAWFDAHGERYAVLVAERDGRVEGWASLNPYSHRCAYHGVADLSVYVARNARGRGVGSALLSALDARAKREDFHKIVLFALANNDAGRRLYDRCGYREVGIFRNQGRLDGRFVDVIAMEKLLRLVS